MTWEPKWAAHFGRALRTIGLYEDQKRALAELRLKVTANGADYLLDAVLDLENSHVVWPKSIWWALKESGFAERTSAPHARAATQMSDVWRLTMLGRQELGRRKMERDTGFEERPATTSKEDRDADVVVFEKPDAEWNF